MKNHIKTGILLTACTLFFSCGDDQASGDDGDDNIPVWNKENTTHICFISKFNNEPLISTDSENGQIRSDIQSAKAQVVLLDRCDVSYGTKITNPLLPIAKDLKLIPVFAKNKLTGTGCEGSGLLLPHTLRKQDEIKVSQDCYLKTVDTRISSTNNQEMVVSTISLQTDEHVNNAKSYLNAAIKQGHVIVGTINSERYGTLEKLLQENASSLRLEKIALTQNVSQQIFILTSKAWILRDSDTETNGKLHRIHLQIERL